MRANAVLPLAFRETEDGIVVAGLDAHRNIYNL